MHTRTWFCIPLIVLVLVLPFSAQVVRTPPETGATSPAVVAPKAQPPSDLPDPAQIAELVLANHILADESVLDAYGHVSVRSQRNPNHFLLARHLPAAVVMPSDIIEYDLDTKPVRNTDFIGYSERFIHGEIYKARP